jgi:hypothetical protein
MYAPILILLGGNVVLSVLVSLTITICVAFVLKGFVIAKAKPRVKSLQRATLLACLQNSTPITSGARSCTVRNELNRSVARGQAQLYYIYRLNKLGNKKKNKKKIKKNYITYCFLRRFLILFNDMIIQIK